jgi:predicted O-linked N-acetylglucosamine transferase (SPINDLY family)
VKKSKRTTPKAKPPVAAIGPPTVQAAITGIGEISSAAEKTEAAGNRQGAIELYRRWLSENNSPSAWVIWFNLGVMLRNSGDAPGAVAAYENAIKINPLCIHARINIGTTLETLNRADEALAHWRTALQQLDLATAPPADLLCAVLNNLGRRLEIAQRYTEAEEMLVRSLRVNPKQDAVLYHRIYLRQKQCAWPIYDPLPGISEEDQRNATSAVAMLSITDDPAIQLRTAQVQGPSKVPSNIRRLPPLAPYHHRRLRVGYLSSNFGMHAVSILTAELYELHDRSRVEVWGFCWSPEDNTEMRARIIRAMDHFVRIKDMSDEQAARAIREAEIDVLVDLQGLTAGCRPAIIAMRPAPVQVTYLGFPGPTGLPEIDYVLCDRYIVPEGSARYFPEKPLYLPECYQINDRKRECSSPKSRTEYGLPDDAFVYCAFNNNIKFTPEIFAAWMRILQRTPGSVLWLLADNEKAKENLGLCADQHNVRRDRLIFAPRVSVADYLGRYAAADLFLDLFPFNGGTTVADALWMGLPVVTLSGRSFASRMAGSLLLSFQLPELVTETLADYEDTAVALAHDRDRVAKLRQLILARRTISPVFDSPKLARQIEDVFFEAIGKALPISREDNAPMPNVQAGAATPPQGNAFVANVPFRLLVEGWRGIAHSYALVNQYQLFAWANQPDIKIFHRDAPFLLPRWSEPGQKSGLPSHYDQKLRALTPWHGEAHDGVFRIHSPFNLQPDSAHRVATFMVTEMGLNPDDVNRLRPLIRPYQDSGGLVVTPSRWAKARLTDIGIAQEGIFVVPHGISSDIFFPLPVNQRQAIRSSLGFNEGDMIFLNVGAGFWNKGLDVLVRAFAHVRHSAPNAKLILKDQTSIYGVSSQRMVIDALHETKLPSAGDILKDIRVIGSDLSLDQLRELFNLADYYTSPYRAEGFNLPVIEALACGTPAIVTGGGATDDFCHAENSIRIPSKLHSNVTLAGHGLATYLEPEEGALIDILRACIQDSPFDRQQRLYFSDLVATQFPWSGISATLAHLLTRRGLL